MPRVTSVARLGVACAIIRYHLVPYCISKQSFLEDRRFSHAVFHRLPSNNCIFELEAFPPFQVLMAFITILRRFIVTVLTHDVITLLGPRSVL